MANEKANEKDQELISADGVRNNELSEEELTKISGGEAPKETVTFEYGGILVER
jgi:bacteriocin-like protein